MIIEQKNWRAAIDDSAYTLVGFSNVFEMPRKSIKSWIEMKVTPQEKNREKMQKALISVMSEKRIPFHPSYGYATPEQVLKLGALGMGPERDRLIAKIRKQTENHGKTKF